MNMKTNMSLATLLAISSSATFADRDAGRDVLFSAGCISCHAVECNRDGPRLGGIMGRRAGSVPDFDDYTNAMKNSNVVWTEDTLDKFLADPEAFIPGNSMATSSGKLEDAKQRSDLIAFLMDPDNSQDLCF